MEVEFYLRQLAGRVAAVTSASPRLALGEIDVPTERRRVRDLVARVRDIFEQHRRWPPASLKRVKTQLRSLGESRARMGALHESVSMCRRMIDAAGSKDEQRRRTLVARVKEVAQEVGIVCNFEDVGSETQVTLWKDQFVLDVAVGPTGMVGSASLQVSQGESTFEVTGARDHIVRILNASDWATLRTVVEGIAAIDSAQAWAPFQQFMADIQALLPTLAGPPSFEVLTDGARIQYFATVAQQTHHATVRLRLDGTQGYEVELDPPITMTVQMARKVVADRPTQTAQTTPAPGAAEVAATGRGPDAARGPFLTDLVAGGVEEAAMTVDGVPMRFVAAGHRADRAVEIRKVPLPALDRLDDFLALLKRQVIFQHLLSGCLVPGAAAAAGGGEGNDDVDAATTVEVVPSGDADALFATFVHGGAFVSLTVEIQRGGGFAVSGAGLREGAAGRAEAVLAATWSLPKALATILGE